jgi:peptidyl-dipeptidase A
VDEIGEASREVRPNPSAGTAEVPGTMPDSGPEGPTADDAAAFVERANRRLLDAFTRESRAVWVQHVFITDDTEILAAEAARDLRRATLELATESVRFNAVSLPADLARQIGLIKLSLTLPVPVSPDAQDELTRIHAGLQSTYGRGRHRGRDLVELEGTMAESRDADELLDAWSGWRTISRPMRAPFARFVELANAGARDLGYADLGVLWRSGYDMPPRAFEAEVERLWQQVRPLYDALHAHVRASLARAYGPATIGDDGLIPAHLLGNMWAQGWDNIYPIVANGGEVPGGDLTKLLRSKGIDELEMVRYAERLFTSLGFDPLPETFWERSMIVKPVGRDVLCHPTAFDIDADEDVRIKMCARVTGEDFVTIHHEMGHSYYQLAYRTQPFLYRGAAHDGFHEAIGDTIALSVTPGYLVTAGVLAEAASDGDDVGLLLRRALERVAFLPFGLLVDRWRWQVFSGEIGSDAYNATWWDLVRRYQGVRPPVARTEADFDPGAKYHIPANVPYARYFLAFILQFQIHRAFARQAGHRGPLHRYSVFGDRVAGRRLAEFLSMGRSRPWPEALFALTGEREMDATAVLEYFAPLVGWLEEQNHARPVGFDA